MKASWVAAAWLCACLNTHHATAAEIDPALAASVDAVAAEWLSQTAAPSVSIAIVQGGAVAYAKAYGRTGLGPATPMTRYAIDSVTKEFTAAALLILEEQGRLSLDDPLRRWFPDLGEASTVTLRQILTHTSGIRDYWPQDFLPPDMMKPTTAAHILQEWVRRPLDFQPGSEWQYSNTGYVLAAEVVAKVAGESLFEFLRRRIFTPLGMAHGSNDSVPPGPQDALGYTRFGLGPLRAAPREGSGWLSGAASLAMPPGDLALWDISLMDRSLLHAASYDEELRPAALRNGTVVPYGLGLDIERIQGRLRIGHSGSGSGFLAENRIWPDERTAIIVLTNNDWAEPAELLDRIAFLVLRPTPAEARVRRVFAALQQGSIDRTLFTPNGNSYLTDVAVSDLHSSLSSLGPARMIQLERESKRGGMLTRRWKILCPHGRLAVIERGFAGGKLEEFLITQRED